MTARILFSFFVVGLIALVIWRRTKRKYEIRVEELKQKNLWEGERNRIASDMHDDILGPTLRKLICSPTW